MKTRSTSEGDTASEATTVQVESRAEWRAWLRRNHGRTAGIWLVTFKQAAGARHVPYQAVVEEALCFGWIDSRPARVDAERSKLWLAPRRTGTGWSRLNKQRVTRLSATGRMARPGLDKVAAARRDGSWRALDAIEALRVPTDLARALAARKDARPKFDAFPRSAKKRILHWLADARTPETRTRRITEITRLAARGRRAADARRAKVPEPAVTKRRARRLQSNAANSAPSSPIRARASGTSISRRKSAKSKPGPTVQVTSA